MPRFMISVLTGLILAALTSVIIIGAGNPPESHVQPLTPASPTSTNPLPPCVAEDGSGQALCLWDARHQGNGQGATVVSGDCAPSIMGEDSDLCMRVHARDSVTIINPDGSSHTIPNGPDIVGECISIANDGKLIPEFGEELRNEGWTMRECLNAF